MTEDRLKQYVAATMRPYAETVYKGLVNGEEYLEWYASEVQPYIVAGMTGNMVANPYYVEGGAEPAQIDDSLLLPVADGNTVNGVAPVTRYDLLRFITLLQAMQSGLDGSRSIIRKFCVRPV